MSRSYWLPIVAAVGLALAGAVYAQPIGDDSGGQARTGQAQEQPKADNTPLILEAIKNEIERVTRVLEANIDKPKSPDEEDRAKSDLRAQEEMAHWAKWLFIAAVASVVLTAAGVLLIYHTLVHTRRAADAARDMVAEGEKATSAAIEATKEAKRQADLAEQSFSRLERPYLFIVFESTGGLRGKIAPNQAPFLRYTFANYGKTPAIVRRLSIELLPFDDVRWRNGRPAPPIEMPGDRWYDIVPPGKPLSKSEPRTVEVTSGRVGPITYSLALNFLIEYQDPADAWLSHHFLMLWDSEIESFRLEYSSQGSRRPGESVDEPDQSDENT